ncbi:FkbM family methyltransferase [Pelagibacteraceae bacterium]|nr:FkbM family methyltransferase [Pelagibacteraceae bacterium]
MENNSKHYQKLINLEHINNNSIILDIGANIGDVTDVIMKKYNPNIYCYEPNISCYNYMLKRFKKNSKIKIFNVAVSNFSGKTFLYFHNKSTNISEFNERSSLKKEKDGLDINKKIEVNCINIKEILEKHNQIDLIKIDIEGSEYEVMPEIIKNKDKIKMVLCETHGNPDGKKIPSVDGSKLVVKNKIWIKDYTKLISKLKELNLYENWFYEWY